MSKLSLHLLLLGILRTQVLGGQTTMREGRDRTFGRDKEARKGVVGRYVTCPTHVTTQARLTLVAATVRASPSSSWCLKPLSPVPSCPVPCTLVPSAYSSCPSPLSLWHASHLGLLQLECEPRCCLWELALALRVQRISRQVQKGGDQPERVRARVWRCAADVYSVDGVVGACALRIGVLLEA